MNYNPLGQSYVDKGFPIDTSAGQSYVDKGFQIDTSAGREINPEYGYLRSTCTDEMLPYIESQRKIEAQVAKLESPSAGIAERSQLWKSFSQVEPLVSDPAPGPAATSDIEESAALMQEIENPAVLESVTPKKGPPVGLLALATLAAWGVFS